MKQVMCLKIVL